MFDAPWRSIWSSPTTVTGVGVVKPVRAIREPVTMTSLPSCPCSLAAGAAWALSSAGCAAGVASCASAGDATQSDAAKASALTVAWPRALVDSRFQDCNHLPFPLQEFAL